MAISYPYISFFQVSEYIAHKNKGSFAKKLKECSHRTEDESIILLWEQVLTPLRDDDMISRKLEDVQSSAKWLLHVVNSTVKYLQDKYGLKTHTKCTFSSHIVQSNLNSSRIIHHKSNTSGTY